MTSLLPSRPSPRSNPGPSQVPTTPADPGPPRRSPGELSAALRRGPLVLVATLGGVVAAASTLVVCLALSMVGWYLADGGTHGEPRSALRIGALVWLTAHRSGVVIEGAPVTAVPWGLTLLVALVVWRVGRRIGEQVAWRGPDAAGLADGQRDATVPVAAGLFAVGYLVVAVLVAALAGGADVRPSTSRVAVTVIVLAGLLGGTGIAVGSGRAAVRVALLPASVRVVARICRAIVVGWLALSALLLVVSLIRHGSTVANIMSQSNLGAGSGVMVVALSLLLVPNAVVFGGSFLLGPGFTVGAGSLVTPSAVVLGPLPLYVPLLAAVPQPGPQPGWTVVLVAAAPLTAALGTVWVLRRVPTLAWEDAVVRGLAGGVAAGVVFAVMAHLAGGSVGPGRLRHVAPLVGADLWHGVVSFGLGGLVAGLAVCWWQRRRVAATDAEATGQ